MAAGRWVLRLAAAALALTGEAVAHAGCTTTRSAPVFAPRRLSRVAWLTDITRSNAGGAMPRKTAVRGLLDDLDDIEADKRKAAKKKATNSRMATTREVMEMRSRQKKAPRKKKGEYDSTKHVLVYKIGGGRYAVPKKRIFIKNEEGKDVIFRGVFGNYKMAWYELWLSGKPVSVERNLADLISGLPDAYHPKTGQKLLREAIVWAPAKKIRTFNPETNRKGTRTLRWHDGERILVRMVLDNAAYELIEGDKRIHGFVHVNMYDGQALPTPAVDARVKDAEEWMAMDHNEDSEQVLTEVGGKLVDTKKADADDSEANSWDPFNHLSDLGM